MAEPTADNTAVLAAAMYAGTIPQPIELAPKSPNGHTRIQILLWRPGSGWDLGYWDPDQYAKKPRPYWASSSKKYQGVVWMRNTPPTFWLPLPPDPK